jgi:hypothetical protein
LGVHWVLVWVACLLTHLYLLLLKGDLLCNHVGLQTPVSTTFMSRTYASRRRNDGARRG